MSDLLKLQQIRSLSYVSDDVIKVDFYKYCSRCGNEISAVAISVNLTTCRDTTLANFDAQCAVNKASASGVFDAVDALTFTPQSIVIE